MYVSRITMVYALTILTILYVNYTSKTWGGVGVKREKNSTYFDNGLRDTSFPERLDLGLLLIIPNEF